MPHKLHQKAGDHGNPSGCHTQVGEARDVHTAPTYNIHDGFPLHQSHREQQEYVQLHLLADAVICLTEIFIY